MSNLIEKLNTNKLKKNLTVTSYKATCQSNDDHICMVINQSIICEIKRTKYTRTTSCKWTLDWANIRKRTWGNWKCNEWKHNRSGGKEKKRGRETDRK